MDEQDEIVPEENGQAESESQDEKSISADLIRGHINTIILRALYDGDKYGYEIIAEIERKSHGQYSLKQPSLYSALKRLESQGYVTSYWGGSVGGGRRKYFSLTDEGKEISERNQSEWEYSRTVIDSLISEKQFDFSNPAPTAVDMRVLKRSTSRVPTRGEDGEEEFDYVYEDPAAQERLREESALLQQELERTRLAFEEEKTQSEETLRLRREELEKELTEREAALREENERTRAELEERRRLLEEDRRILTELQETRIEEQTVINEEELQKERDRYEQIIAERERQLNEEREAHAKALEEQERIIREEDAKLMEEREAQIRHENYLLLVNSPAKTETVETVETAESVEDGETAEETVTEEVTEEPLKDEPEYRTVVRKLYSNTVREEEETEELSRKSASRTADGMDFYDLETLAAKDGIKINTAGSGKEDARSASVINKGKVFFFCAIVVFLFCLAEGSVILALLDTFDLPVFYPYLIWAIGLALLLVTGVAYANRYGERALRRAGNFLINAIVVYALLVIFTLILALGVKIDFTDPSDLSTFVIIPIIFFFNVVIFAIAYVVQMREKR